MALLLVLRHQQFGRYADQGFGDGYERGLARAAVAAELFPALAATLCVVVALLAGVVSRRAGLAALGIASAGLVLLWLDGGTGLGGLVIGCGSALSAVVATDALRRRPRR